MIYIYKIKTNEFNVVDDIHATEKKLLERGVKKITDVRIIENPNCRIENRLSFIAFIYYEATMEVEL